MGWIVAGLAAGLVAGARRERALDRALAARPLEYAGSDGVTMKTFTRRAASLVELLLALTLTAVLGVGAVTWVVHGLGHFAEVTDRLATARSAEAIFLQVQRDLSGIVIPPGNGVGFAATLQSAVQSQRGDAAVIDAEWSAGSKPTEGSLQLRSNSASGLRFGQAGVWWRFFTQIPDTGDGLSNLSAPRAVSYQIVRRRLIASASAAGGTGAPVSYLLYRGAARPAGPLWTDTNSCFAVGYDLLTPAYVEPDAARIDNVGNVRSPRRFEQLLANNVVDFGVRVWVVDPVRGEVMVFPASDVEGFLGRRWPAQDGRSQDAESLEGRVGERGRRWIEGRPVRVDVVVRLLTPTGARRLRSLEDRPGGLDARAWWAMVERESRVFVRAFRLPEEAR